MIDEKAKRSDPIVVEDQSINHYLAERLSDGRVRIRSGGHVVVDKTYYKALKRFAESEQEHLEDLPDHLREDQWNSPYNDVVHPNDRLPVVYGITSDGEKRLLRVCDFQSTAERVADAYRDGGTIQTVTDYVEIGIDRVRHGGAR